MINMKQVKCVLNSYESSELTYGKIYDIIEYYPNYRNLKRYPKDDSFRIKNDLGGILTYSFDYGGILVFTEINIEPINKFICNRLVKIFPSL